MLEIEFIELKRSLAKLKATLRGEDWPQQRPAGRQIKTDDGQEMEFVTGSTVPFNRGQLPA